MIDRVISFIRSGLDDDEATRSLNINGHEGCRCVCWLKQELAREMPEVEFDFEPAPEDWGWAMVLKLGPDLFLLGCSKVSSTPVARWQVRISDNFSRGVLPATRRRKTEAVRRLSRTVEAVLRSQACVYDVQVERGALNAA
ncbi:hypothetical protein GC169_05750 [bacterium]|nr:hypothetical protein [bacterium]